MEFNLAFLFLSWLCVSAATVLGAWEWAALVRALYIEFDLMQGIRASLFSNLAKYIPGFIWSYVGKAYGAARLGVPNSVAGLSVVLELGIVYISGFLLMLISIPFSGFLSLPCQQRWFVQIIMIPLVAIVFVKLYKMGQLLLKRLKKQESGYLISINIDWNRITMVFVAVLLTWGLLGLGFGFLVASITTFDWYWLPRLMFSMITALLLGQVAFFVPMGIGVREAVFITMLQPVAHPSLIVIMALAFRLESLIGEVFVASLGYISGRLCSK
ncbi:MAG: hypothetical protein ACP5HM_02120 [Anaerolineae bacterium]